MSYVHLHARSHMSFLQAVPGPKKLAEACKKRGFGAMALTDSGAMCGIVEWYEAMEKNECKPIIGVELWTMEPIPDGEDLKFLPGHQLVLLAKDKAGYESICKLVTLGHRQMNAAPRISIEQLGENRAGIVVLTGSRWGIFSDAHRAEQRLEKLLRVVNKDDLWVEVVDIGLDEDGPRNELARTAARSFGLGVVATNDVRYIEAEEVGILEAMYAIGMGEVPEGVVATDQAYLKTSTEMSELFPVEELDASGIIADGCTFSPVRGRPMLPRAAIPENASDEMAWKVVREMFPPPKSFPPAPEHPPNEGGSPLDRWFRWYARTGLDVRLSEEPATLEFGTVEEYQKRLEWELSVIERMEYPTYHLIVAEFINWAKDNGISVGPGRGSAAGSVVVWAMRITDPNPIQLGLMFERFLNPERRGLPDIDVDFEQTRREEVIRHVRDKYGEACVGQILTIGTMKAKAALKDAARACNIHFLTSNAWSDLVEDGPKAKLKTSLETPVLARMRSGDPAFRRVSDLAVAIEGKPRQTGIHAAGVIIASDPIEKFCPLHFDEEGRSFTGVAMEPAEQLGLVKFDFLGLKTLDVIEETCRSVERRKGKRPQINDAKYDDPAVYELLRRADGLGLFQVESRGMIHLLKRLKPDSFEDVISVCALYRPGPLRSGMVDQFIECKHGMSDIVYPHELLETVLKATYGVIVYQEQVMASAQILAGYSLGEADLLRRAMGKKKPEEMAKQKASFTSGCKARGIDPVEATKIFDLIDHFSGYGFNRSHSAAYAAITYQTAKLKAHHRVDFMASALSFELGKQDRIRDYVADTRRAGIGVNRPDVNLSEVTFTVEEDDAGESIRFGLGGVKGLGALGEAIVAERRKSGHFRSPGELVERVKVNKTALSALVWSGALDGFSHDRFETWWALTKPQPKKLPKKLAADQLLLFSPGRTAGEEHAEKVSAAEEAVKPERPTFGELVDNEYALLGTTLSTHPLARFSDLLGRIRTHRLEQIYEVQKGKDPVVLVGRVEKIRKMEGKRNDEVVFFSLEDGSTSVPMSVRGDVLEACKKKEVLVDGNCVLVEGMVDAFDPEDIRVLVQSVDPLSEVRARTSRVLELEIRLEDEDRLPKIREVLTRANDPSGRDLRIRMIGRRRTAHGAWPHRIRPDDSTLESLERILGRPRTISIPGGVE